MINELFNFLKKPVYLPYTDLSPQEKRNIFSKLLVLIVTFSFCLGLLMGFITTLVNVDLGAHEIDKLFANSSTLLIILLAVILAPLIEEFVFRGPLVFFKNSHFFNYIFYFSTIIFGAVHLSNFESIIEFLWLAPILVAPQISAGFFLGFARVKLGLGWSILLHACHNAILLAPLLLSTQLGIAIH